MEWEMMRGTADGQEPGTEGGRSPTGGPGSCPSAAARGPGEGQGEACPPGTVSMPAIPPDMPEEPPAQADFPGRPDDDLDGGSMVLAQRRLPRLTPSRGKRLVKPEDAGRVSLTPEQRLLILDTWLRSGRGARSASGAEMIQ